MRERDLYTINFIKFGIIQLIIRLLKIFIGGVPKLFYRLDYNYVTDQHYYLELVNGR